MLSDEDIVRLARALWEDPRVQDAIAKLDERLLATETRVERTEGRVTGHLRDHHKFVESVWKQ